MSRAAGGEVQEGWQETRATGAKSRVWLGHVRTARRFRVPTPRQNLLSSKFVAMAPRVLNNHDIATPISESVDSL